MVVLRSNVKLPCCDIANLVSKAALGTALHQRPVQTAEKDGHTV